MSKFYVGQRAVLVQGDYGFLPGTKLTAVEVEPEGYLGDMSAWWLPEGSTEPWWFKDEYVQAIPLISVGDHVRVTGVLPDRRSGPAFNKRMDKTLGAIGKVIDQYPDKDWYRVAFPDGIDWYYAADWLTTIKDDPAPQASLQYYLFVPGKPLNLAHPQASIEAAISLGAASADDEFGIVEVRDTGRRFKKVTRTVTEVKEIAA